MTKKILIIEDLESQRLQLQAWLAHPNIRFFEAAGKRDGVRIANEASPDLVLLDIVLSDGDGFETCGILREVLGPEVPIIVVSSRKRGADQAHMTMMGATGYVPKDVMNSREAALEALRVHAPEIAAIYATA